MNINTQSRFDFYVDRSRTRAHTMPGKWRAAKADIQENGFSALFSTEYRQHKPDRYIDDKLMGALRRHAIAKQRQRQHGVTDKNVTNSELLSAAFDLCGIPNKEKYRAALAQCLRNLCNHQSAYALQCDRSDRIYHIGRDYRKNRWSYTPSTNTSVIGLGAIRAIHASGHICIHDGNRGYYVAKTPVYNKHGITAYKKLMCRGHVVVIANNYRFATNAEPVQIAIKQAINAQRDRKRMQQIEQKRQSAQLRLWELAPSVWVRVEDSIMAGNCKQGTDATRSRLQQWLGCGDISAVRGDALLQFETSPRIRRAVVQAIIRMGL